MFWKKKNELKVQPINREATMPTVGSKEAAGLDLYACTNSHPDATEDWNIVIPPHSTKLIPTGIVVGIPKNYFGGIFPRSGMACKHGVNLANCVGVIDSDYRGEVLVALRNNNDEEFVVNHGDRIAQLVLIPHGSTDYKTTISLDETERGSGGFGSTGR